MTAPLPLVVFSDLDGTLLDHATYRWEAAQPALTTLERIGALVVLASSKTAVEMTRIQQQMGLAGRPAIVENGAGMIGVQSESATPSYDRLRALLDDLPAKLRSLFEGFGDMDVDGICAATGLAPEDARRAKTRAFSEPGLWHGTAEQERAFVTALAAQGITARRGGRFLTLSFGRTKADAMAQIIALLQPAHTMALGDAPNDAEMLEAADFGVVVYNPHGPSLPSLRGESEGRIIRTTQAGPAGWNAAVLLRVENLNLSEGLT